LTGRLLPAGFFGASAIGDLSLAKPAAISSLPRVPDWLATILLGLIEGVTEFIPVSSTGHLLLAEKFLHVQRSDLFLIVIQCAAVLAVLPLFPRRLYQFVFEWRERETQDYLLKIFAAFFITGSVGLLLDRAGFELADAPVPIAIALLAGGLAFLAIEFHLRGQKLTATITWPVVLAVALGQLIAGVFPGTSRSGATILLALLLGLSRPAATEFSFLVGIPTMLAAGGLKIFKALRHPAPGTASEDWGMLLLGCVVAAVVSFLCVKWLLRYVQTHSFTAFGWYRIILGIVILVLAR
jgi:undecaprenyl-diphosphatase